jgi:hypothetical protein
MTMVKVPDTTSVVLPTGIVKEKLTCAPLWIGNVKLVATGMLPTAAATDPSSKCAVLVPSISPAPKVPLAGEELTMASVTVPSVPAGPTHWRVSPPKFLRSVAPSPTPALALICVNVWPSTFVAFVALVAFIAFVASVAFAALVALFALVASDRQSGLWLSRERLQAGVTGTGDVQQVEFL